MIKIILLCLVMGNVYALPHNNNSPQREPPPASERERLEMRCFDTRHAVHKIVKALRNGADSDRLKQTIQANGNAFITKIRADDTILNKEAEIAYVVFVTKQAIFIFNISLTIYKKHEPQQAQMMYYDQCVVEVDEYIRKRGAD